MKEIFIERQEEVLRIAIKKNNKLKECFIQENTEEPVPGEIYKGIVKNIVPAIKGAFIDIGYKTNCYMYMDRKFKNMGIKKGDELLVQVVKEASGKKEPKVTSAVSIPGRYCVLNTLDNKVYFSKKINDDELICYIKDNLKKPQDIGIMIRTNGGNVPIEVINEEIKSLYSKYNRIKNKAMYSLRPSLLLTNGGILGRILRDKLNHNTVKVYVNNEEDYELVKDYIKSIEDINVYLDLHKEEIELFDYYGIEKEILQLRNSRVQLPCGGHIVIEKTEAMYTIDVNSGKNVKSSSIKNTAFITNMQAAEEIVDQIRLRNLSGIIVIDFIDINDRGKKRKILNKLYEGFEEDKNKTIVYPFTQLNLIQIARKKVGKPICEYIDEKCEKCNGSGHRIKFSYLKFLIKNEINKVKVNGTIENVYIMVNKVYEGNIRGDIIRFIEDIRALDKRVYLSFIDDFNLFKVEPLIFKSQIEDKKMYEIYSPKKLYKG